MTVAQRIKDRRIGIVGAARSGMAAALLCQRFGGRPFVSDNKDAGLFKAEIETLRENRIPYEVGGHTEKLLECEYLIVSPGVPLDIDILRKAREKGLPLFSEIEVASWVCRGQIVAITGSNGKTTTTALLGKIFETAGYKTYVCGNIGAPFADVADRVGIDDIAVVEVSNFQLETISDFKPDVALILNLSPDHLDRHGTFDEYKKAKYRIAENMTADDSLILNADDAELTSADIATKATRLWFGIDNKSSRSAFADGNFLCVRRDGQTVKIIDQNKIRIRGPHNLANAAAAALASIIIGVEPKDIALALEKFSGVEHRLENVGRVAGISFVNDSKATNVDSVCYALRSIDTPIHLILGGKHKGASYTPLIEYAKGKVRNIVAIGEAKEIIFNELGTAFSVVFADTLEEAVGLSFEAALPGETVLLSPACASFDMFENYEHRGQVFKTAVSNLKNGKKDNETVTR